MKLSLLIPLTFVMSTPMSAGIYYYPSYQNGIEVRCKDGKPKHLVEITKSGRGLKLDGHGESQYSWPITYLFPEASNEKYKYFPSTAGTQCSHRKLDEKEKNSLLIDAFKTCVAKEDDGENKVKRRSKYCFGWN